MPLSKTVKREFEVAFSRRSQPIWFRILKYAILIPVILIFWASVWLWIILSVLFAFALWLHFWYRYKTQGWTRNYGMWKYFPEDSDTETK
jgi:hypothetical protein